ncbi:MAG: hypothetical protein HGA85_05415 [Nanoarchaeota archaeon]|nr:hypothetical protein [Nanoarchaeota archaeon]
MISFIEGTLLISNALLILLCIAYGFMILRKKKREESRIWLYFLIACGLYFTSELFSILETLLFMDVNLVKAGLRVCFGTIVLLAFITKYSSKN